MRTLGSQFLNGVKNAFTFEILHMPAISNPVPKINPMIRDRIFSFKNYLNSCFTKWLIIANIATMYTISAKILTSPWRVSPSVLLPSKREWLLLKYAVAIATAKIVNVYEMIRLFNRFKPQTPSPNVSPFPILVPIPIKNPPSIHPIVDSDFPS